MRKSAPWRTLSRQSTTPLKRKKNRKSVQRILKNKKAYAEKIREILLSGEYKPKPYKTFTIYDGSSRKERTIHCPAFYPDQIVHWAIMQVLQPIIMRSMYAYSCGSVPGRGIDYGRKAIARWLKRDRKNTKYCLKLDITKFYPHIDKEKLKEMFRRKIKDERALALIDAVIDSHDEGMPIGTYTSQWFANFSMEGLDHYIKEDLGIKYYLRYTDDMVLFGANKKKLHIARRKIEEYIKPLNLTLKNNWQVFKVDSRPVDILGYKFYHGKTTLRRRNSLRIRRKAKRLHDKNIITPTDARGFLSHMGQIKHSNSREFYKKYIKPCVNIRNLRRIVSNADRIKYTACVNQC